MLNQIKGLHHVTSMASDARANNAFFTDTLGLRRVKKTVNFDAPDVYHLYYGDEVGTPGSVMTYFPFPNIGRRPARAPARSGRPSSPCRRARSASGASGWRRRASTGLAEDESFGEKRLSFAGPDGDELALVEADDARAPWTGGGVPAEAAIRGFHGASLRLRDAGATGGAAAVHGLSRRRTPTGDVTPLPREGGNGADVDRHRDAARRAAAPVSAPARCTTSPSRCPTGRRSSRCARR